MSLVLALMIVASPEQPESRYRPGEGMVEICGVSGTGAADLVDTIMKLPDIELVEEKEQYLTLLQQREQRFWTFAINGHPAAPAIICRTIKPAADGGSTIEMEVSCFADKSSCDQLAEDFTKHNQRIVGEAARERTQ